MTRFKMGSVLVCAVLLASASASAKDHWHDDDNWNDWKHDGRRADFNTVQLGPRPFYLVDDMDSGHLKNELKACMDRKEFHPSTFSIGHRGAGLQFPEHSRESYTAAAREGAGIIECDVTFTKDKELVCRHDMCDLHTTTDILSRPELAAKCTQPFVPAANGQPAQARCCTTDITLAEFKSLCAKMDGFNPMGTTPAQYMAGTPNFRTDLYATCATPMTHKESIELIGSFGRKFTPELKTPPIPMPFDGFSQQDFADKLVSEYKAAHVDPKDVFVQSFLYDDILYLLKKHPHFGKQAVFLESVVDLPGGYDIAVKNLDQEARDGVQIVAPPMWVLVTLDKHGKIVPSSYARKARRLGFDIITWTLERSGFLNTGGSYYYQSVTDAIDNDGDTYTMLDVLARDVGIRGIFSDWPATVTYYANCMGL